MGRLPDAAPAAAAPVAAPAPLRPRVWLIREPADPGAGPALAGAGGWSIPKILRSRRFIWSRSSAARSYSSSSDACIISWRSAVMRSASSCGAMNSSSESFASTSGTIAHTAIRHQDQRCIDGLGDGLRCDAVLLVVRELLGAAAIGFVNRAPHRIGDGVGVHQDAPVHVTGRAPDGLNKRAG